MMRSLLLAFALSTSLVALSSAPAMAQTTDQTDQSEEDWRKSRKKNDTSDIFENIKNSTGFGTVISQTPMTPMESLPEDSRRHLMKERAKVIATTETGQPVQDAPYQPSEEAKTDPDLAEQEKEAWDVIMTDLKGGSGQGQPGTGPNKVAVAGQGGSGSPSNSTMRGGSSQSVAEILAQIKGMKSGGLGSGTQGADGSGQSPLGNGGSAGQSGQQAGQQSGQQAGSGQGQAQGQTPQGQSQQGQAQQGQDGQAQQASAQNSAQGQSQSDQSGQSDASADASAQSDSSADSTSADSAQAAADAAEAEARAEQIAQAEAHTHSQPEPIGPLDRIKQERASGSGIGSNTSASDFLKKKTTNPN